MSISRVAGFEDYHNVGIIYSMSNFGVPQADGFGSAYYKQSGEMYGVYTDSNGNYINVEQAHTDTQNGVTTIKTDNRTLNGKAFPSSFTVDTNFVPSPAQVQNNITGANAYIRFSFIPAPDYAKGIDFTDLPGDPRSTSQSHIQGSIYYSFEFTITDDSDEPDTYNTNFYKQGLYLTGGGGPLFFKPGVFYDKATSASFLHDTVYRFNGATNFGNFKRHRIKKGKNRFDFSVYYLQNGITIGFYIPTEDNLSLWVNGKNRWNGTIKDISIKRRVYDDNRAINNPVIPELPQQSYYYYSGNGGIGTNNF
tara:strand:+ start:518 stop:1441 length:924 start_codon:yes stop_codon:yes gene_type:complete